MRSFLEETENRVLVCDGAMGTMLYARGVFLNRSFDELNLTGPDQVEAVHKAYVEAGADVLETNTFGANQIKLAPFGLVDRLHATNVEGARIARRAAGERAYVAGAIGPLGLRIEPWGKIGAEEAEGYFRDQAAGLLDGGIDLFVLETFRDLTELAAAIRAVRSLCDLPIVAQMTTEEDGNSLDGTPPETFTPELERQGADVIGVNCSVGPAPMLDTIERMASVTRARLSAQPNAGKPRDVEGRNIYLSSPEYMASYARRFISHGVKLVGGCCGTTPEHIRHIKTAVQALASGPRVTRAVPAAAPDPAPPVGPVVTPRPRTEKSRMAEAISRGTFLVSVEVLPPKGYRYDRIIEQAGLLRGRGVEVMTISDAPWASARLSALSVAVLLQQQAGIETVLHYTCRDRHLMGMQSDLLGAHALGLRNLLISTGEPPRVGDYPDVTLLSDVDSIGLTNAVARLNRGLDVGGQPIGEPTGFHIGVGVNPTALDLDEEIRRFEYKIEAGAEFAVTPPIFDLRAFETFLRRVEGMAIPIIAGLWAFDSLRSAEFMANEVPGVRVPGALIDRMRRRETPEAAAAEGVTIAREIAAELASRAQGVQIATPNENIELALAVIE